MQANGILFGIGAHTAIGGGEAWLRMLEQADRAELDLFSLSDHPYVGSSLDAYAAIGIALGRTQRLAGFANVTNLPTRPPAVLARTVATLSSMTNGRVVLGMGVGGRWDQIAGMGAPRLGPAAAVAAFEEAITLIKAMFNTSTPVTFEGRYYQVHEVDPSPVPAPPVWTGSVGPKSLAATGRVADGWIPGHAADWLSTRFRESRPLIDEAAVSVGRDPSEIRTVYNLPGRITSRPLPTTRDNDGRWVGGSAEQWIEELTGAVQQHDATGFMLFSPGGGSPDADAVARWSQEIVPGVRERIKQPV